MYNDIKLKQVHVQNIVTHKDYDGALDLSRMATDDALVVNYNPELFPGLRLSLRAANARATVFFQGKVIVTGCRSKEDVRDAWEEVHRRIDKYRVETVRACDVDGVRLDAYTHSINALHRQIDRLTYKDV